MNPNTKFRKGELVQLNFSDNLFFHWRGLVTRILSPEFQDEKQYFDEEYRVYAATNTYYKVLGPKVFADEYILKEEVKLKEITFIESNLKKV